MRQIEDRYISLLTDFGFKRIFGTALNKELLICFLNSVFQGREVFKNVFYLNSEHLGQEHTERNEIFDLFCENEKGEKFIMEMQNAYMEFFEECSLFYSVFPIREQSIKGLNRDFKLCKVYIVSLLDCSVIKFSPHQERVLPVVKLCDIDTHNVFSVKSESVYVDVAGFDKDEEQLVTLYDKWLYVLKNLSTLTNRPKALRDKVFDRLFEEAEIARFSPRELREYEDSCKAYRDLKNSLDTALHQGREKGREKGLAEGRAEGLEEVRKAVAQKMKSMGMTVESICQVTDLTAEQILSL